MVRSLVRTQTAEDTRPARPYSASMLSMSSSYYSILLLCHVADGIHRDTTRYYRQVVADLLC